MKNKRKKGWKCPNFFLKQRLILDYGRKKVCGVGPFAVNRKCQKVALQKNIENTK
jgi:hypothetical protein